MSLVRNGGAAAPRPPLWRADAAERLRALLPEMALLVVTTTCFSIAISLDGATNLLTLCVKMAVCQLIVQTVMYAFTYLSEDRRMVSLGPIIVLLASYVVSALPSFRTASVGGYGFATFMAMYLGVVEFCVTRLRVTFVFLLIELVVLIGEVAEWGPLMALHLVAIACLFALFFIRSSAVHITVGGELAEPAPTAAADEGRERPILGIYAQVAAVGVAACVLCLAMALATMPLWWPGGGGAAEVTTVSSPDAGSRPVATSGDDGATAGGSPGTTGMASSTGGASPSDAVGTTAQSGSHGTGGVGWIALALPLLALLPFAVRWLVSLRRRQSIKHERTGADRVARLYQAIVDRLAVAGVVRDESDTPQEFLVLHGDELTDLTASAGLGNEAWEALPDAYPKARYAGDDPTSQELETSWQLYDALPGCLRRKVGWRRYLLEAFWRL